MNNNFKKEKDELLSKIKFLEESEKQFCKNVFTSERSCNSKNIKENNDNKIFYSTCGNFHLNENNENKENQIKTENNENKINMSVNSIY